jgi:hypothetical protein
VGVNFLFWCFCLQCFFFLDKNLSYDKSKRCSCCHVCPTFCDPHSPIHM